MRKLLLLLAVLGLLVVADVGARRAAEAQLETRIRNEVRSADRVRVHLDSVPFLARLAFSGRVKAVRATVDDVAVSRLRFRRVTVDLRNVKIDRDRLLADRQLDLQVIDRGMAVAELSQSALREALGGIPVVLETGRIGVTVAGVSTTVEASVRSGVLRLSAGRLSIPAVTIPKLPLLPCVTDAEAGPGYLRLSCRLNEVPQELLREVNTRTHPAAAGSTSQTMWSARTWVAGRPGSPWHTPAKASRLSSPETVKITSRPRAMPE